MNLWEKLEQKQTSKEESFIVIVNTLCKNRTRGKNICGFENFNNRIVVVSSVFKTIAVKQIQKKIY